MILSEVPYRRREYTGRDSSANILAQAVWAQREESLPRTIICRRGREHGVIIGVNAQMGVRRIARQLRKLVPQFELTTGYSPIIIAAAIWSVTHDRPRFRLKDLSAVLDEVDLRILY